MEEWLRARVYTLAADIGERNVFRPRALGWPASFIVEEWRKQGFEVASQTYRVRGLPYANLEVACRETEQPERIVLVGAHYDSVLGSPVIPSSAGPRERGRP